MSSVLVLGGARSGKSRYAEGLGEHFWQRIYIATAGAEDDEMRARIARHQQQRGNDWRAVEEPLDLVQALQREDGPGRFILVDCLTLWLSNLMHQGRDVEAEVAELAKLIPHLLARVVFVSNEVGQSIVPDNALARAFRDAQGRCNQVIASRCDEAVLVVAGLALPLKSARPKEV